MQQTKNLLEKFSESIQARDLEKILELFADEVDWDVPGDRETVPWLGKRKFKPEVKQFYELLWRSTEPISSRIERVLIDGSDAVIVGSFRSKMLATGVTVDSPFFSNMRIGAGRITKYTLLEDSYAIAKAMIKHPRT